MELQHNKHCVGEASFHIVYCPKFRHGIFFYEPLNRYCEWLYVRIADKYNFKIRALRIMGNHLHLFVSLPSKYSVSQTIKLFKGISSRKIFQAFPWLRQYEQNEPRFWGGHFWSRGYFYRSVGSTTDKAVEFYIKVSQDDELKEKYYTSVGSKKHQGIANDPILDYLQGDIDLRRLNLYKAASVKGQVKLDAFCL